MAQKVFQSPAPFERGGGGVDRLLVEVLANQHGADRQPVAQSARDAHRRMARHVEGRGVADHFERALEIEAERRVRRR